MNSSKRTEQLPEGVMPFGWRYKVRITTPRGPYILPKEFETVEQAEKAYREAMTAQWNG